MRIGNVGVIVPQGREKESGHVQLEHGKKYTIQLLNYWHDRRLDAVVTIDGKDMGTYRVDNGGRMTLERPSHDEGCFTFYAANTEEYAKAGGGAVAPSLKGVLTVVFKPEKKQYHQMITRSMNMTKGGPEADYEVGGAPQYMEMASEEKTSGGIRLPDTKLLSRSRGPGGQSVTPGITGLSGHSSQRFVEVKELDYDPAEVTTVNLRLVAWDAGPRPLEAQSAKANPVPAPVA